MGGIGIKSEKGIIIARQVREAAWDIIQRSRSHRVIFLDLFKRSQERIRVRLDDPEFRLRRDYFITSLLATGSNITLYSDGSEFRATYSHLVEHHPEYKDNYLVLPGKSKAEAMRRTARDELQEQGRKPLAAIRRAVRARENLELRIQALLIRKAQFVIISEKGGVFISPFNRVRLKAA